MSYNPRYLRVGDRVFKSGDGRIKGTVTKCEYDPREIIWDDEPRNRYWVKWDEWDEEELKGPIPLWFPPQDTHWDDEQLCLIGNLLHSIARAAK